MGEPRMGGKRDVWKRATEGEQQRLRTTGIVRSKPKVPDVSTRQDCALLVRR